jgi:ADP-ribosylglycohydrolase
MDRNKIKSSLYGFIIGDSLGVPYEFNTREKMKRNPVTTMVGGGTWSQPKGTFSDDSSMVLSTLDSLSRGYNLSDLGYNFDNWLYSNHFTPHNEVFDCGNQTRQSLSRIHSLINENKPITPLPPSYDETKNGNGSLMRILPFGFYLQNYPIEERWKIINEVSSLTHPHIRSIIGCFIYTELVMDLVNDMDKVNSYNKMKDRVSEFLKDKISLNEMVIFNRILKSDIRILREDELQSTPYVVYTLESVLWCFLNRNNYKDSVLTGINLGGDTDTIGSLIGGLSGIIYNDIPQEWKNSLVKKEEIFEVVEFFIDNL